MNPALICLDFRVKKLSGTTRIDPEGSLQYVKGIDNAVLTRVPSSVCAEPLLSTKALWRRLSPCFSLAWSLLYSPDDVRILSYGKEVS
jgi:hypothetical protein